MMKGIWFGDIHSYANLNLILSKVDLPPATVKETYVDNPGGDGSWDLTEANGKVNYKDRKAKFTFSVLPGDDFEAKKTEVSNLLNGRRFKIVLDKDPEYYWDGRCSVNKYESKKKDRKIVVAANVSPYKLKKGQTRVFVPFSGRNLFNNAELPKIGGSSANIESIATGVRATWVQGKSAYVLVKWLPLDMLIGETITLSCDIVESGGAKGTIQIGYAAASGSPRQSKVKLESTGAVSFTVENTNPQFEYLAIWFYANNGTDPANVTAGAYVDYLNVQIELGEVSEDDLFSKNLISYPYNETTLTLNGITFTDNGDGSITINGTASNVSTFYLSRDRSLFEVGKTYTIQGSKTGINVDVLFQGVVWAGGGSFTVTEEMMNAATIATQIRIPIGNTINNVTVYPMLSEGSTALPYEPYWRGYEHYVPFRGKNLLDLFDISNIEKYNSVEFGMEIVNSDIIYTYNYTKDHFVFSCWVDVEPNTDYSISLTSASINACFVYTDRLFGTIVKQVAGLCYQSGTFNSGENSKLLLGFYSQASNRIGDSETISNIMINKGSTALPYEPYNPPAEVTLTNGRKQVVPTLICTTETKFDVDGLEFTVNEGKHKVLDFQLTEGETHATLRGEGGAAAIVYQEGDL